MSSRRRILKTVGIASAVSTLSGYVKPSRGEEHGASSGKTPKPKEQKRIQQVGYDDLDGRNNAFKMSIQEIDGHWYLYLAHFWNVGWSILEVTDPKHPEYVKFVEGPTNTQTTEIQVVDGTLVINNEPPFGPLDSLDVFDVDEPASGGLQIFDVSNPTEPEELGRSDYHGTHRNHYDGGDTIFAAAQPTADWSGNILTILDISDPENPVETGRAWWPGQAPDEEPDSPSDMNASLHGPAYPASGENPETAYLSYSGVGMVNADISDPADPTLTNRVTFGDVGDTGVSTHTAVQYPDTDIVWTSAEALGEGDETMWTYVFAIDKSEPDSTKILSVLPTPTPSQGLPYDDYYAKGARFGPHNQHHYQYSDDYYKLEDYLAYTWFNAGLRLFDVSNTRAPKEVGYYVPENPETQVGPLPFTELKTQTEDVLIDARGYIYITHKNQGVHILKSDLIG